MRRVGNPVCAAANAQTDVRFQALHVRCRTVSGPHLAYAGAAKAVDPPHRRPISTGDRHDPKAATSRANARSGAPPDAFRNDPADSARRTLRGARSSQEHGTERSQGCPVSRAALSGGFLLKVDGLGVDPHLPSGRGFIALLEAFRATGGTAPGEVVGRLLQEHCAGGRGVSLAKPIYTGQVFGFEWRAALWVPMFQFDLDDLALKAGAQRVREALPALWPGWTLAVWFATPNAQLEGRSPVNVLDLDLDAVLQAAHSLEPVEAFSPATVRRADQVAAHV